MGYARYTDSAIAQMRRSGMCARCFPFAFPAVKRHFVSSPTLSGALLGRGTPVAMQLKSQTPSARGALVKGFLSCLVVRHVDDVHDLRRDPAHLNLEPAS